ncbi:MAG: phosphoethanolamine--lipid A transferase [Brachymonas sp.]|nr:phosphoethanolamine--lipid A transferase [Brachymonas sp.]
MLTSVFLATVGNIALWKQWQVLPELAGMSGFFLALGTAVVIASLTALALAVFAWRSFIKPVLLLFVLAAAAGLYFMLSYNVVIDKTMMLNVLLTDKREVIDLLNVRMVVTLLVLGIVPGIWLWRQPVRKLTWLQTFTSHTILFVLSFALGAGALFAMYRDFSSLMRNHTQLRYLINPLNSFYALGRIAATPFEMQAGPLIPVAQDAHWNPRHLRQTNMPGAPANTTTKAPLVVLVVGETARAANFSLNGYTRPTNPMLQALPVISQQAVSSCGTSTATSLPCMFSSLGKEGFESRKQNYENMLDVMQHADVQVRWIDNQPGGCKGVCDRVPTISTAASTLAPFCKEGECLDEVMLQAMDEALTAKNAIDPQKPTLVVMHQMGSHGPAYFKRSPADAKPFQPECQSNTLQDCDSAQIVNAYDNSLVYTDRFLAQTIAWLNQRAQTGQPTALVYVSDHGESLGENNLYLHGLPYSIAPDVQKQVPWISWSSPSFLKDEAINSDCLRQQQSRPISHDYLFHSMLNLLDVENSAYRPELDLYAACRKTPNS